MDKLIALPGRAWRAWRGAAGDEIIWLVGIAGVLAHALEPAPIDPLGFAVVALLLLHSRQMGRTLNTGADSREI